MIKIIYSSKLVVLEIKMSTPPQLQTYLNEGWVILQRTDKEVTLGRSRNRADELVRSVLYTATAPVVKVGTATLAAASKAMGYFFRYSFYNRERLVRTERQFHRERKYYETLPPPTEVQTQQMNEQTQRLIEDIPARLQQVNQDLWNYFNPYQAIYHEFQHLKLGSTEENNS